METASGDDGVYVALGTVTHLSLEWDGYCPAPFLTAHFNKIQPIQSFVCFSMHPFLVSHFIFNNLLNVLFSNLF